MILRIKKLFGKVKYSLAKDGIAKTGKRIAKFLKRKIIGGINDEFPSPEVSYMDVLFINGCTLPHPTRYRVTHQIEQLKAGNILSNEIFYEDLTLELVKNYRTFIFYRCPYTEVIGEFIKKAKKLNKSVLFDIDDLVIDTKYTDLIKYVKTMSPQDLALYNEGVERMRKTLLLCDGAITTTERLAEELKHYVPKVYINRNTASSKMIQLSQLENYYKEEFINCKVETLSNTQKRILTKVKKELSEREGKIRLGYFSGSITHNDDILMILPVVERILKEYPYVELHIVGELDIPVSLMEFKDRIKARGFVDWQQLPHLISSVDINLAPLESTIFNEAKSENKWIEASLVKVPTVASNLGAFKKMMKNEVTGYLCDNNDEWYTNLIKLIEDKKLRRKIGKAAYEEVLENCTTIYNGYKFAKYIIDNRRPNLMFVMPSVQISGGVLVILKHAAILQSAGIDVTLITQGQETGYVDKDGAILPVLSDKNNLYYGTFDKGVATLWSTLTFVTQYEHIKEKFYFVQNFETDFYEWGHIFKVQANQTYNPSVDVKFITISAWCKDWLEKKYGRRADYAPNGLDLTLFKPHKRKLDGKIKILIEGNSEDYYKNVDESFKIVDLLDKDKYEIWYLSYQGTPKKGYYVDRFMHKVPYEEVSKIYGECDILLKTSILESFSYPPLEMMGTGGYVVVAPNGGNIEYLVDRENCLFYSHDDLSTAVNAIEEIRNDLSLQEKLYAGGVKTAKERDWNNIEDTVLSLYNISRQ
ncbi:glycosyltransferase [Beduini massiliensis]|uniref:glycosyltransferase n=1 Tax=Beduini massiliensis TaxID=1585974 RepID=UPI00059AAE03|nr:glycosyltransferase [Beduini massiliensis]